MNSNLLIDNATPLVCVDKVSKSFVTKQGSITALDQAELYVGKGEIVGLCGNSGEGKSTLVNIMCGVLSPDCGNVLFCGQPLWHNGRYDRNNGRNIQPVFQQPFGTFDPYHTVGFALTEVAKTQGIKGRQELRHYVEDLACKLNIQKLLSRKVGELSGGQAQRCAIARALAVKPQMLVADESTAMLDVVCQAEVMSMLTQTVKNDGISLLIISHDIQLLNAVAQRIYVLQDGKLSVRQGDL